ncbi:MAG: pseudouridine-5'-phosphate glycosidase [Kofleriaceae bacterium]
MQLQYSAEVTRAREENKPIVALESTLVAHGLPYPDNYGIAIELEQMVRTHGAVPATIAIVDGKPCIGLELAQLEMLAKGGRDIAKAGATDLAVHLARGTTAATTVSATALLAARAGIRVFATGGIGGVHRGDTGDVSHDLVALSRTPIAVISAGAKAILDLPKTVEMLETLGVLVIGFRADELPAFYTPRTEIELEHRVESAAELAKILHLHWDELDGKGVIVANPIPAAAALDETMIGNAITQALGDAETRGITGKRLTPYLLQRLASVTGGQSIKANRALALDDARVGAELAVQLLLASGAALIV